MDRRVPSVMRRRLAPFAGAGALGLVLGVIGSRVDAVELAGSVALTITVLFGALWLPWARLPSWTRALPPFGYLLAVALLRDATGGALAGFAPLLLLPLFWVALYGTRRQLLTVLAATAAVFYVPMLTLGAPNYPVATWRAGALFVVVGAIVGFTVQGLVARLRAVLSERELLIGELQALAATDSLTGLANRRAWDEAVVRGIAAARRTEAPVCVVILDIDHFKRINDAHGHLHGDHVLQAVAARWLAELRPGDVLARLGGEEFAALLLGCEAEAGRHVAERMRAAMPAGVTCSAGVAEWDGRSDAAVLVAAADETLYVAKRRGRDQTAVAPPRSSVLAA